MIEAQTPNTVELANVLPLATERQDMREQWLRRLLASKALNWRQVIAPFAQQSLAGAARNNQTVQLSMDQTEIGNRMALLMITVRVGDRSLPLAWIAAEGEANIGFDGQRQVLELLLSWLPDGVKVMLSADRFYPSIALFEWLQQHQWQYRLRLKRNLIADLGHGDELSLAEMTQGVSESYLSNVRLFTDGNVLTNIGILHESGHQEAWIIAMDCRPSRAKVLDYAARWVIEPTFSDFKSRGFELQNSQLQHAKRFENLVLIMALAMHWCVRIGIEDAIKRPTPLEIKTRQSVDLNHWCFKKLWRSQVSFFTRGLRYLKRCLQISASLPKFSSILIL